MSIDRVNFTFSTGSNRFNIECLTNTGDALTQWFIGITGPTGVLKEITAGPDAVGINPFFNIPNPEAAFTDGDHIIEVRSWPSGNQSNEIIEKITFDLQQTGVMTYRMTHDSQNILVEDKTIYPSIVTGTFSRSSTLVAPIVPGLPSIADVVFAADQYLGTMSLSDGMIYQNVTWIVSGTASGTFELQAVMSRGGTWQIRWEATYSGGADLFVVMVQDICGILACVDTTWLSLWEDACSRGGISKLPDHQQDQMAALLGNIAMYNYWTQCEDFDKASEYYDILIDLVKSDCQVSTEPSAVGPAETTAWVDIPDSAFINGFQNQVGNTMSYRVVGKLIFFRGAMLGTTYATGGTDCIDPAFWTAQGVTFEQNMTLNCMDVGTTPLADLVWGRISVGTIRIYRYASSGSTLNPFTFSNPIMIQ